MRRFAAILLTSVVLSAGAWVNAQGPPSSGGDPNMQVILLGTASGPNFNAQRLGISTLVVAGPEKLLFDAGRNLTTGMTRLAVNPVDVTKIFLTHLHSDHIISLPELLLFPWPQGRKTPLKVWGPTGTRSMMQKLQEAFAVDIRNRRHLLSADGANVVAADIREGVVYESNGVKVTAFLVDHSSMPAFGYRVDFRGRSVAISGDTKPSENLVKFASGVDVIIHEINRWKQDPVLTGPPDELLPNSGQTRRQAIYIAEDHTDGAEAGKVFDRVKPKLAIFSHYGGLDPQATLALVRQNYSGPVEFGEDLMTIDIASQVSVRRFAATSR
jgi:ribonuclease Z